MEKERPFEGFVTRRREDKRLGHYAMRAFQWSFVWYLSLPTQCGLGDLKPTTAGP